MLFNLYNFHEDWARDKVGEYISPNDRVLIIPFSFGQEINDEEDWEHSYSKEDGEHYKEIIEPFLYYGIKEKNINWINYYKDTIKSAQAKVRNSDIIFFTGGFPDKLKSRLNDFHLIDRLESYKGIMIGSSAGAMIQIAEYHITPDEDYDKFKYSRGLNIIKDFGIEVHYEARDIQKQSIEKLLNEKKDLVYAITNNGGLIFDNGKTILLGEVESFIKDQV